MRGRHPCGGMLRRQFLAASAAFPISAATATVFASREAGGQADPPREGGALGVPGPADWGSDKTYPIEANFDLLHGIDFKKGCFVGQETTSRMKRRGQIIERDEFLIVHRRRGNGPASVLREHRQRQRGRGLTREAPGQHEDGKAHCCREQ